MTPATGGSLSVEVFCTLAFNAPRPARRFAEVTVRNIGLGRPAEAKPIFTGKNERRGRKPKHRNYSTRVVTRGVDVTVGVTYTHSRIEQYLMEGRAGGSSARSTRPTTSACSDGCTTCPTHRPLP